MQYKMNLITALLILSFSGIYSQRNFNITPQCAGNLCFGQLINSISSKEFVFEKVEFKYANGDYDSVLLISCFEDSIKLYHTRIPNTNINENTKITNLYIDFDKLYFKSGIRKSSSINQFRQVIDEIDFYDAYSGNDYLAQYRMNIEFDSSSYILIVLNFEEHMNMTIKDTIVKSISLHQRPFGK